MSHKYDIIILGAVQEHISWYNIKKCVSKFNFYIFDGVCIMEIKGLDLSPTVSMLDGIQESLQANQNAMIASMRLANQAKVD